MKIEVRRWALSIALLVAVAVAVAWHPWRTESAGTEPAPAAPVPEAVTDAPPEPAAATAPAAAPKALAREAKVALANRPLLEQLDRLAPAARAGDDDAACRLGTAILRCLDVGGVSLPYDPEREAAWIANEPPDRQARIIEIAAKAREQRDRMIEQCRGIEPETHQRAALEFLLLAAQRGNPVAQHAFVAARVTAVDLLRDPAIARIYGDNAPRVFRTLWDAGDPRAIELLGNHVGGPQRDTRAGLHAIPPELRDAELARALRDVQTERIFGFTRRLQPHEKPLEPETREAATRLWDEHFEHSRASEERRAKVAAASGRVGVPGLDPASPCDEASAGG